MKAQNHQLTKYSMPVNMELLLSTRRAIQERAAQTNDQEELRELMSQLARIDSRIKSIREERLK